MVKIMENPIKMDDLGVPLFLETPICEQMMRIKSQQSSRVILLLLAVRRSIFFEDSL